MYIGIDMSADAREERSLAYLHAKAAIHQLKDLLNFIEGQEKESDWFQKIAPIDIERLEMAIRCYNRTLDLAKELGYAREDKPEIKE